MSNITLVILSKAEGTHCYENKEFPTLRDANHQLNMDERPDLGYYKYDFEIRFANGETYKGRYDLTKDEVTDIADHVRRYLRFGLARMLFDPEDVESAKDILRMMEGE